MKKKKFIANDQIMYNLGFDDGYKQTKKQINHYLEKLVKAKKYNKEQIIHYLTVYNVGYTKGNISYNDLSELKSKNGILVYKGLPIDEIDKLDEKKLIKTIDELKNTKEGKK